MSRKKVHHEEHADESWLLPYSDLLTLLLALFIVMFAISQVDNDKLQKLSSEFEAIFSGETSFLEKDSETVIPSESLKENPALANYKIEDELMSEIKRMIEEDIKRNGYADRVKVALDKEGLEISIQEVMLFNSGDAEVLESVTPLLKQISRNLSVMNNKIKVAGHTDNVPIHTSNFRSNWDLSAMRAINVMTFLVGQGGLNPERFSVQGYGEYSPIADNSTIDGRAKNRRVEIYLIRKYPLNSETVLQTP